MEIKPSCPIIIPPGAKNSSYLLIAQWLPQLEFRRADPAGMCSAGRAPHTWLCPTSCCTPQLGPGVSCIPQLGPGVCYGPLTTCWACALLAFQLDVLSPPLEFHRQTNAAEQL